MPQMLLAADERLEKSLVASLQAKGWSVRVVRFLSEIPDACESEPLPEVIAATFPAALGAHHALAELTRDHGARLLPIVALVPEASRGEASHLTEAGASAVFAGPVPLKEFHTKAASLADAVRAERERLAEEARKLAEEARKLAEQNSMPPTQVVVEDAPTETAIVTESPRSWKWAIWLAAAIVATLLTIAVRSC